MRQKYDFTAPAGTHFGIIKSVAELLAEIPGAIDYWDATAASMTVTDGRVSAWNGLKGARQFVQATAAARPILTADGLAFHEGGAASGRMSLAGAALGTMPALTIAARVKLHPSALTADGQAIWAGASPILRMAVRYSANNNYLRASILSSTANRDVDLPDGQADIGVVFVANGTAVTVYVAGGASGTYTASGQMQFSDLNIGANVGSVSSFAGWYRRFGIWAQVPTAAQLETLLGWVA